MVSTTSATVGSRTPTQVEGRPSTVTSSEASTDRRELPSDLSEKAEPEKEVDLNDVINLLLEYNNFNIIFP